MQKLVFIACALLVTLQVDALSVRHLKSKSQQRSLYTWNDSDGVGEALLLKGIPSYRTVHNGVRTGGHPFAVRRSADYALELAKQQTLQPGDKSSYTFLQRFEIVLATAPEILKNEDIPSMITTHLVDGGYENEMRTELDNPWLSFGTLTLARTKGFTKDPDFSQPRCAVNTVLCQDHRSKYWKSDYGYASSNPIHSMIAEPDTVTAGKENAYQLESWGVLKTQMENWLTDAIFMVQSTLGALKQRFENKKNPPPCPTKLCMPTIGPLPDATILGYYRMGNVFHTVQDSAVSCTPKAKALLLKQGQDCQPGDGHSILEQDTAGNWKVATMGTNRVYAARKKNHQWLDALYTPANVEQNIGMMAQLDGDVKAVNKMGGIYESFDPAIAGGRLLIDFVKAVWSFDGKSGSDDEKKKTARGLAQQMAKKHIYSRYLETLKTPPIVDAKGNIILQGDNANNRSKRDTTTTNSRTAAKTAAKTAKTAKTSTTAGKAPTAKKSQPVAKSNVAGKKASKY